MKSRNCLRNRREWMVCIPLILLVLFFVGTTRHRKEVFADSTPSTTTKEATTDDDNWFDEQFDQADVDQESANDPKISGEITPTLFRGNRGRIVDMAPKETLLIGSIPSLDDFDDIGKYLIDRLGYGKLSPLALLKLTVYGKVIPTIEPTAPCGLIYFWNGDQPAAMILLPVDDYTACAKSLGVNLRSGAGGIEEKIPLSFRMGQDFQLWFDCGYAVIVSKEVFDLNQSLIRQSPSGRSFNLIPNPLIASDMTLYITSLGVSHFFDLINTTFNDSQSLLTSSLDEQKFSIPGTFDLAGYLPLLSSFIDWTEQNVQEMRLDLYIKNDESVVATTLLPNVDSELLRQNLDEFSPMIPCSFESGTLLSILPEYAAPIAGQLDLHEEMASKLEQPFDRIRHIEYSFALPADGQLLAESWAFFLEVDDAEAFIQELLIPKGQMIGSHIGSERLGELGAQLLGNLAARRQSGGGLFSRLPRLTNSPEEAASLGGAIGAMFGTNVGRTMGEREAMKLYDFHGYEMLISDVELYTRQMREIQAQQAGIATGQPILITGEPTFQLLIGQVLSNLQSGNLEGMMTGMMGGDSSPLNKSGELPFVARENFIVQVSPHHLIIVPGDEAILKMAVDRWEEYLRIAESGQPRQFADNPNSNFATLWQSIANEIPALASHRLRTATSVDLYIATVFADDLRTDYFPGLPEIPFEVPEETPAILTVSTTDSGNGYLFAGIPHSFTKWVVKTAFEQIGNQIIQQMGLE